MGDAESKLEQALLTTSEGVKRSSSTARLKSSFRSFWSGDFVPGLIGLLFWAACWEAIARSGLISNLFFSPMTEIVVVGWEMYASGFIWQHLAYTLGNFTLGFVIGTALGVPLGLFLGWYRGTLKYVDPVLSLALATPVIVIVPVVIVIFGIFWQSKVAITIWSVFFAVVVSTIAGVQSVDAGLVKVARSFQANDFKIIRDIVLPGSIPSLVGGLRLGMTRGLVGELAAEFFGSQRGLGYLAFNYSMSFQPAQMFVAVLTMAALGVLLTELFKSFQKRFDSWRPVYG